MASADAKCFMLVKSLLAARDILLEELQRLSKAIDQPIDLTDFISKMDDIKFPDSAQQGNASPSDGKVSAQGKQQNGFEVLTCFMQHFFFFWSYFVSSMQGFVAEYFFVFFRRKQPVLYTFKVVNLSSLYQGVLY